MKPRLSYILLSVLLVYLTIDYSRAQDSLSVETDSRNDPVALIKSALRDASLDNAWETTEHFYTGLENLSNHTYADTLYTDVIDIMTSDERKAYKNATDKGLALFGFWQSQDPTPATFVNERIVEHYQRLDYARRWYGYFGRQGYDDRGMIYVQYGPPDDFIRMVAPQILYDNECWVYKRHGLEIVFDFIFKHGMYEILPPDRNNIGPTLYKLTNRMKKMYDFSQARAHISYQYASLTSNLSRLLANPDAISGADMRQIDRSFSELYQRNIVHKYNLPQVTTDLVRAGKPLKGAALALARFFPEQSPRLEIYLGVSCEELVPDENNDAHIIVDYVIRDSCYNVVLMNSLIRNAPISDEDSPRKDVFIDQISEPMSPGQHSMAIEIRNPKTDAYYEKIHTFHIPVSSSDNFVMSDIELAYNIQPRSKYKGNRAFIKGDYAVTPYPFYKLKRDKPVYVYFELYNLLFRDSGYSSYEVEYEVRSSGKGFLKKINPFAKSIAQSSSYELRGEKKNTQEYFSLNLEKMKPGDYRLGVKVTDRVSGKTQESALNFSIIE